MCVCRAHGWMQGFSTGKRNGKSDKMRERSKLKRMRRMHFKCNSSAAGFMDASIRFFRVRPRHVCSRRSERCEKCCTVFKRLRCVQIFSKSKRSRFFSICPWDERRPSHTAACTVGRCVQLIETKIYCKSALQKLQSAPVGGLAHPTSPAHDKECSKNAFRANINLRFNPFAVTREVHCMRAYFLPPQYFTKCIAPRPGFMWRSNCNFVFPAMQT